MGYAGRQAPLTAHPGASEQECDLPPRRHILGSPYGAPRMGVRCINDDARQICNFI